MIQKIQNYNFKAKQPKFPCYAKKEEKFVDPTSLKQTIQRAIQKYPNNNIVIVTHNNKMIFPKR